MRPALCACKGLGNLEAQEKEHFCGVCRDVWAGPKEPASNYVLVIVLCLGEPSLPVCLALVLELSVLVLVTEEGKEGTRKLPHAFSLFQCAPHDLDDDGVHDDEILAAIGCVVLRTPARMVKGWVSIAVA